MINNYQQWERRYLCVRAVSQQGGYAITLGAASETTAREVSCEQKNLNVY